MDMKLLAYEVNFDEEGVPAVKRKVAGNPDTEALIQRQQNVGSNERTEEGWKLEIAYRILEDFKGIETSEEYLEEFADRFLEDCGRGSKLEITPGQIEEWLDKELDAPSDHITGGKQDRF